MQEEYKAIIAGLNNLNKEPVTPSLQARINETYASLPNSLLFRVHNFSKINSFADRLQTKGPIDIDNTDLPKELCAINELSVNKLLANFKEGKGSSITINNTNSINKKLNLNTLTFNKDCYQENTPKFLYTPKTFTLEDYRNAQYKQILFARAMSYAKKVSACPVIEEVLDTLFGDIEKNFYNELLPFAITPSAKYVADYKSKDIINDRLSFLEALISALSGNYALMHYIIAFLYHGKDKVVSPHPKIALFILEMLLSHGDKEAFSALVYLSDYRTNQFNIDVLPYFEEFALLGAKYAMPKAKMLLVDIALTKKSSLPVKIEELKVVTTTNTTNTKDTTNVIFYNKASNQNEYLEVLITSFLNFTSVMGLDYFVNMANAQSFNFKVASSLDEAYKAYLLAKDLTKVPFERVERNCLNDIYCNMQYFADNVRAVFLTRVLANLLTCAYECESNPFKATSDALNDLKGYLNFIVGRITSKVELFYLDELLTKTVNSSIAILTSLDLKEVFNKLSNEELLEIGALYLANKVDDKLFTFVQSTDAQFLKALPLIKEHKMNDAYNLLEKCALNHSQNALLLLSELICANICLYPTTLATELCNAYAPILGSNGNFNRDNENIFSDYHYIFSNLKVYEGYKGLF